MLVGEIVRLRRRKASVPSVVPTAIMVGSCGESAASVHGAPIRVVLRKDRAHSPASGGCRLRSKKSREVPLRTQANQRSSETTRRLVERSECEVDRVSWL